MTIFLQFLTIMMCLLVGARLGGMALGLLGGIGVFLLTFIFHLPPSSPPVEVLLLVLTVVVAASTLETSGGIELLVKMAERILQKNPKRITFIAPIVTYFFTFFAGTGHVSYSVLPVIAEVAKKVGIRPERPLSIAVIASQVAITACPISAATVAFVSSFKGETIEIFDILKISFPATLIGVLIGAIFANRMGEDIKPEISPQEEERDLQKTDLSLRKNQKAYTSLSLFLLGITLIILFSAFKNLRPVFAGGETLDMAKSIQMIMLTIAGLIVIFCRLKISDLTKGVIIQAGIQAVIAIFGIAWMGDTFFVGNESFFTTSIQGIVTDHPFSFAFALFGLSVLLNSQAATIRSLMPLGIFLGIPQVYLIAMFPAVNGYFFIPNYPPIVAAINFDTTGTTKIGKYLFNHSFMIPGLITVWSSVLIGLGLIHFLL